MKRILPLLKCWTLWYALVLLSMPLFLLAQEQPAEPAHPAPPATEPADAQDPQMLLLDDTVIRLPDGREVNLADLNRDGGAGVIVLRMEAGDGGRNLIVTEDDRRITIHESDDEIVVTVKEGDADPQQYRAANAEELEKDHPEAYEVYQRYAEELAVQLPPPGMGGIGDRVRMRVGRGGAMPGMFPTRGMLHVESLGISCNAVVDPFVRSQLGNGFIVTRVEKESIGEQVGLQRWDLIKSINGQELRTIDDIDDAVLHADKLQIEVIRGGKPVTLEEK